MGIKEKLTNMLDLPKEVTQDAVRITIVGDTEMSIENYKGILEYEDTIIRVKTSTRALKITGMGLNIRTITDEDILVYGRIDAVCFC